MKILSFDVGIVNLAYCIFDTLTLKIEHWEIIKLENTKDHGKLHLSLITELDNRPHLIERIDTVLIEKQPSFNPKMRIIAGCLQTYFFIRGMIDSEKNGCTTINTVKFFSPKHKLKCYTGSELVVSGKNKYTQTKQMSVLICKHKLVEYSEPEIIKDIFENSKKKDDLADCYLQAITYAIFQKLIPESKSNVSIVQRNKVTKKSLKDQIINILGENSTTSKNTLSVLNDIPNIELKSEISEKCNITFPLTETTLKTLFTSLTIKKSLIKG
jgi:hypothetical protein